jgi:hypothetical protein
MRWRMNVVADEESLSSRRVEWCFGDGRVWSRKFGRLKKLLLLFLPALLQHHSACEPRRPGHLHSVRHTVSEARPADRSDQLRRNAAKPARPFRRLKERLYRGDRAENRMET